MADDRLRRLERLAAQGDPQARARLLNEQVRAGSLLPERLGLLAYLGDPEAQTALGAQAADVPPQVEGFLRGLRRFGRPASAYAAAAAVRCVVELRRDEVLTETVLALEAWADCPCGAHRERAAHLDAQLVRSLDDVRAQVHMKAGDPAMEEWLRTTRLERLTARAGCAEALGTSTEPFDGRHALSLLEARGLGRDDAQARLRAAVSDALAEWARPRVAEA